MAGVFSFNNLKIIQWITFINGNQKNAVMKKDNMNMKKNYFIVTATALAITLPMFAYGNDLKLRDREAEKNQRIRTDVMRNEQMRSALDRVSVPGFPQTPEIMAANIIRAIKTKNP